MFNITEYSATFNRTTVCPESTVLPLLLYFTVQKSDFVAAGMSSNKAD